MRLPSVDFFSVVLWVCISFYLSYLCKMSSQILIWLVYLVCSTLQKLRWDGFTIFLYTFQELTATFKETTIFKETNNIESCFASVSIGLLAYLLQALDVEIWQQWFVNLLRKGENQRSKYSQSPNV